MWLWHFHLCGVDFLFENLMKIPIRRWWCDGKNVFCCVRKVLRVLWNHRLNFYLIVLGFSRVRVYANERASGDSIGNGGEKEKRNSVFLLGDLIFQKSLLRAQFSPHTIDFDSPESSWKLSELSVQQPSSRLSSLC